MLSLAQVCRCSHYLRAPSRVLLSSTKSHGTLPSRQLLTPAQWNHTTKGLRISEIIKRNGIVARFCASSPKPKSTKIVGYWLLGCSGMVFTAVVLGMAIGYLIILYSIYYVVNVIVKVTNGTK